MATYCSRKSSHGLFKFVSSILQSHKLSTSSVRCAIYPANYQQPTVSVEQLKKPLEDSDPRKFQPIRAATIRQTTSLFYDETAEKFTGILMKAGNRARVQDIFEKTLESIKRIQVEKYHKSEVDVRESIECNPLRIFHEAVKNCEPELMLVKIVKGGVAYQVPTYCKPRTRTSRSMKWIIGSCRDKERRIPMEKKLAFEMLDAFHGEGKSIRKKLDLHKQCLANRAYAHYRW